MTVNKKLRIAGLIVMIIAIVFIIYRFFSYHVDITRMFSAGTLPILLLVTACVMLTLFLGSCCWRIWLSFFAKRKTPLSGAYSIYVRSNVAKYLPGNFAHFAMRQLYGTSLGVRQQDLLLSSALEIGCTALMAFVLSLAFARDVFLSFVGDSLQRAWVLPAVIAVVAAIAIVAAVYARKKGITASGVASRFREKGFYLSILSVLGLTACILAIYGLTQFFLISAAAGVGENAPLIISAGIVSWFIGFITPGVPGGIGVREAVLYLMLSPILPDDVVLYAAVTQRVAYILSDVFSWLVGIGIDRRTARPKDAAGASDEGL